jgi:hypothetical protein
MNKRAGPREGPVEDAVLNRSLTGLGSPFQGEITARALAITFDFVA